MDGGLHDESSPPRPTLLVGTSGTFEVFTDGTFKLLRGPRAASELKSVARSETDSMQAEISSTPDVDSAEFDEYWCIDDDVSQHQVPISDIKSTPDLLLGSGGWDDSPIFCWLVEPVSVADVRDIAKLPDVVTQGTSHSIAESADSGPGLTEASTRDSDILSVHEQVHRPHEVVGLDMVGGYRPDSPALSWHPNLKDLATATRRVGQFDNMHIIADLCLMGCGGDENGPAREPAIPSPVVPSPVVSSPIVPPPTIPPLAIPPLAISSPVIPSARNPPARKQPIDVGSATDDDTLSVEEGPPSPESGWMSDYSESVPVFEGGHPFLRVKTAVVQKVLDAFAEWDYTGHPEYGAAGNHQGYTQYPSTIDVAVLLGSEQSGQASGKRLVSSDGKGGGEENGEDGGSDPPKKRRRSTRQSTERRVSLACPFAKKDPNKYRHCYSYILSRTQDVKQHLSRCHQLPIYCPRCKDEFQTEPERDQHCVLTNWSCQIRTDITHEGVTRSQKEELGHRVSPRQTLEEQWFTIFDILFPQHSPRPRSAFVNHHLSVEMEAFQDMMFAEGPALILQSLQENQIQLSTIDHQEHELSDLFQVAIAEGLHTIAQRWMESHSHDLAAIEDGHLDGAGASETSRRNARSITSIASSETLVERRRSSRQPQALLGPLNEEGGSMGTMMVSRGEMHHGITTPLVESGGGENGHRLTESEQAMGFGGHFLHVGEDGEAHHVQHNGGPDETFADFATLFQDPEFRNIGGPVRDDAEDDVGS